MDHPSENVESLPEFLPGGYFFRRQLRTATTVDEAIEAGLIICREWEELCRWVEETTGQKAPRFEMLVSEAVATGVPVS